MSIKEASHRVRIAQDSDGGSNNGSEPHITERFLILRTTIRMYIGEVLDIFKKGSNGRYGSIESAASTSEIHAFSLRVYLPLQTMISLNGDESDEEDLTLLSRISPVFQMAQGIICILR
ncbi:hypothetical protein B0H11DRAFT_1911801 [Mycena galericulata]|nr:hypothetical protein B0H11DRAFT_1911801 [Mycena galericulata]